MRLLLKSKPYKKVVKNIRDQVYRHHSWYATHRKTIYVLSYVHNVRICTAPPIHSVRCVLRYPRPARTSLCHLYAPLSTQFITYVLCRKYIMLRICCTAYALQRLRIGSHMGSVDYALGRVRVYHIYAVSPPSSYMRSRVNCPARKRRSA